MILMVMEITTFKQQTYPYIKALVEFLFQNRDIEGISEELMIGMNYSIILNSACYIEGVLESILKEILHEKGFYSLRSKEDFIDLKTIKDINQFYNRIIDELENKIARSTGISNYDNVFELLTGEHFTEYKTIKPLLEGVQVLFQFRNMLAHGREITAKTEVSLNSNDSWAEFYFGGYRKVEDYLIKKGFIDKKFIDNKSDSLYFTNETATHFWSLAKDFVKQLSSYLNDDIKRKLGLS